MPSICLYLHLHQPWRYHKYSIFDVAKDSNYWYEKDYRGKQNNERIFKRVAEKSYHPMLDLLEKNLKRYPEFKISLSITGTWLEQAEEWDPSLTIQLARMISTGRVEIVGETYYHSLAFFYDKTEFQEQVRKHSDTIARIFGVRPRVFRNTELAYNDEVGKWAKQIGYSAVLTEGWDGVLGEKSPNYVYTAAGGLKLLLKNYRLSDDIAFRFADKNSKDYPLTVDKYFDKLKKEKGDVINLFMDFETFGENVWKSTGIFEFIDKLIYKIVKSGNFMTVSEEAYFCKPAGELKMPETVTWADSERDLSAWLGNDLQIEAEKTLYEMLPKARAKGGDVYDDWRRLSTSDHVYYMSTKYWSDGDVHTYFSPFDSPYDAFMYYMNVLRDLEYRLNNKK